MNNFDRINLEKMIKTNNVEDCTQEIRDKGHSILIQNDLNKLLKIKKENQNLQTTNPEAFDQICVKNCQFLFTNYTDIYNKVKKDEIDLKILGQFLIVLKEIEDGKLDQHEGAYKIGNLLKNLYIDSAVRKADKLNKDNNENESTFVEPKKISFKEFKQNHINK